MSSTYDRVRGAAPTDVDLTLIETKDDATCVRVSVADMPALARSLKEQCGFETNSFVTAIDRSPKSPRFDVSYMFLSMEHNDRLRVVVSVEDGDQPTVPSITEYWPGAGFSERECYDMFGIQFEGNADLRRLLMPDGYDHFPLRKDFPHAGIEPDRLYREWDRSRRQQNSQETGNGAQA